MKKIIILLVLLFGVTASFATTNTIELTKTNFAGLRDTVSSTVVEAVLDKIYKSDPTKEFYITIDSPGGSVFAGLKLVRFLQTTDRKITCVASTAISMAFIILQSCKKRVVLDTAVLMTHGISADFGSQNIYGIKNGLLILQGLEDMMNKLVSKRLKLSVEEYVSKLNPEYWLVGGTVIMLGNAADSVENIKCNKEVESSTEDYMVPTPLGAVKDVRPLCPF